MKSRPMRRNGLRARLPEQVQRERDGEQPEEHVEELVGEVEPLARRPRRVERGRLLGEGALVGDARDDRHDRVDRGCPERQPEHDRDLEPQAPCRWTCGNPRTAAENARIVRIRDAICGVESLARLRVGNGFPSGFAIRRTPLHSLDPTSAPARPRSRAVVRTSHRRNIEDQENWRCRHCSCCRRQHSRSPAARAADAARRHRRGDATAIITTNGSEPQNPLIPTNTNEIGGGKILDAIFAGLVYYDADGRSATTTSPSRSRPTTRRPTPIKLKAGQKFTNGEPVTADSFVDAWNYGALRSQRAAAPATSSRTSRASATTRTRELTGLKVVDDTTFTVKLNAARGGLPAAPRLLGVLPAARVGVRGHRGLR